VRLIDPVVLEGTVITTGDQTPAAGSRIPIWRKSHQPRALRNCSPHRHVSHRAGLRWPVRHQINRLPKAGKTAANGRIQSARAQLR